MSCQDLNEFSIHTYKISTEFIRLILIFRSLVTRLYVLGIHYLMVTVLPPLNFLILLFCLPSCFTYQTPVNYVSSKMSSFEVDTRERNGKGRDKFDH